MIYSQNKGKELNEQIFQNPTIEYRGIPFWSWNCRVTKEHIDRQLDCFQEMGFGGVIIHPRSGLNIEYLGKEFMQLVEYTVDQCKEKGIICWLYDEDRFPSGVAGGKVTKNWHYRGRYLLLTEKYSKNGLAPYLLPGYCKDFKSFEKAIEANEKPLGYYATAYSLVFEDGYLKEYHRLYSEEDIKKALKQREKVRFAYVKLMDEEHWFEDQTYVDTMNPEAIGAFIQVTHEKYYRKVGSEFGKTIPAIFTDEPRLGKHKQITFALSDEDVTMPYTEYFAEQMQERYGLDPLDIAPEYIWELAEGKKSVNRYRYRNLASECFVRAFMDQIGIWCDEHGIAMTGHVLSEESLSSQAFAVGDCMRCYRNMHLPGIDILADRKEFATVKQAVSVSKQNGREGTVSELYGVTHWDCDFKTYKLQGDWQAALGITIRVPHLSYMSMEGEAKRDWPASIFYQSPWYKEYPYIEDYFSRLNTVLTRGRAITKIGVVHPVESIWLYFGPDDQTKYIRDEMDKDFENMVQWLLYGTLDFDFLSESLLPEQCMEYRKNPGKLLRVGEMAYSAVVVPGLRTIRSSTLEILEVFRDKGGKLIFMGHIPDLVDAVESDRAKKLAERSICIPKSQRKLLESLEEERDVEIRKANGCRSDNLFYQLREDGFCKWLFICHVNRKRNQVSVPEKYTIRIKGSYQLILYNAMTGEKQEIPAYQTENCTVLSWTAYSEDSILLQLKDNVTEESVTSEIKELTQIEASGISDGLSFQTVTKLMKPDSFKRQEKNVLLLDYARYQLDDGPIRKKEEILRLDNHIRSQLGFLLREGRMNQPWAMEEKENHKVTLYYDIQSEIETSACLAIERPERCRIFLNGEEADRKRIGYYVDHAISVIELPIIREGTNQLIVEIEYNQKTNLENLYLLGEFNVDLRASTAVIKAQQDSIMIGDITRQGMPFYTGNLEYRFKFTAEVDDEYYVHIPHFKAPVLAIYVDGIKKGLIAYAPHRLCLGRLEKGEHELMICLYGNRFNGFGTLHNANDEYIWYGPDSFRTTGDEWTDSYLVRLVGILSAVEIERKCHKVEPCFKE